MIRLGYGEYLALPNKAQQGRPSQYFIDRQTTGTTAYLYLTPDNSTDSFLYWKLRRLQDAGRVANDIDAPHRMRPALVSGMAFYLGQKRLFRLKDGLQRLAFLKQNYEEDLQRGMEKDRERTSLILRPGRRRR